MSESDNKIGAIASFKHAIGLYTSNVQKIIMPFLVLTIVLGITHYLDFVDNITGGLIDVIEDAAALFTVIGVGVLILSAALTYVGYVSLYSVYPHIYSNITGEKMKFKIKFTEWKRTLIFSIAMFLLGIPALLFIIVPILLFAGGTLLTLAGTEGDVTGAFIAMIFSVPFILAGVALAIIYSIVLAVIVIFVKFEYFLNKRGIIDSIKASYNTVKRNAVSCAGLIILSMVFGLAVGILAIAPTICCFFLPVTALVTGLLVLPIVTLAEMKLWTDLKKPKKAAGGSCPRTF